MYGHVQVCVSIKSIAAFSLWDVWRLYYIYTTCMYGTAHIFIHHSHGMLINYYAMIIVISSRSIFLSVVHACINIITIQ